MHTHTGTRLLHPNRDTGRDENVCRHALESLEHSVAFVSQSKPMCVSLSGVRHE